MRGSIQNGEESDSLETEEGCLRSRATSLVGSFQFMLPKVQMGGEWSEQFGDYPIGGWRLPCELFDDIPTARNEVVERVLQSRSAQLYENVKAMGAAIPTLDTAFSKYPMKGGRTTARSERDYVASVSSSVIVEKHRRYDKPFFFRDKAYHTVESLVVEAFAENDESWNDAILAVGRGYLRKGLESNDDDGT